MTYIWLKCLTGFLSFIKKRTKKPSSGYRIYFKQVKLDKFLGALAALV